MPCAAALRRGLAGSLGLMVLVAGCAGRLGPAKPALVPVSLAEAPTLVGRWEAAWQDFTGLIAAVEVTSRSPDRTERSAAVLVVSPRAMRVEVATPFGLPGLVAVAGPERITIFRPLDREAIVWPASAEAIGRWIGVPLPLEALLRLLAGLAPTPPPGSALEVAEDGAMAWQQGGLRYRVWVTSIGLPGRLQVDGREPLTASIVRTIGGGVQSVTIEAPQRGTRFEVAFRSVEASNPGPETFDLQLPSGVRMAPAN